MTKKEKQQLILQGWKAGVLRHKLRAHQEVIYKDMVGAINDPNCSKYTINSSRRIGKSTVLILICIEFAIKNPGSEIRYAAPTAKQLKTYINPIFRKLLIDCPSTLRPIYNKQEAVYYFSNGSTIHLAGTDAGGAENLRGTGADLSVVDEAGFCSDLEYLLKDILLPQTIERNGTVLIASTPAKTPDHYFTEVARECKEDGFYSEYTIYDNTWATEKMIDTWIKEAGGVESTTFKREYLCKFIADEDTKIIREWDGQYIEDKPRDKLYKYWQKYVAMDLGVKDFTAVLFAHYKFDEAVLYIEDELTMSGGDLLTKIIASEIKQKEKELWEWQCERKVLRVSDNNNLLLLQDLTAVYDLPVNAIKKESLDAMVNKVRIWVQEGKIRIHPRCQYLLGCLDNGVWDKQHKAFSRSKKYNHYDHLAALIYLVRFTDTQFNPVPRMLGLNREIAIIEPNIEKKIQQEQWEKILLPKYMRQ